MLFIRVQESTHWTVPTKPNSFIENDTLSSDAYPNCPLVVQPHVGFEVLFTTTVELLYTQMHHSQLVGFHKVKRLMRTTPENPNWCLSSYLGKWVVSYLFFV